jgi:hypothetical protein
MQMSASPNTERIMQHFEYEHLADHLQQISQPCGDLATLMLALLPPGPERSAGLRKLLEAKDCFVRAKLDRESIK